MQAIKSEISAYSSELHVVKARLPLPHVQEVDASRVLGKCQRPLALAGEAPLMLNFGVGCGSVLACSLLFSGGSARLRGILQMNLIQWPTMGEPQVLTKSG